MERIGIYGGTFDPPHLGHIRAAEAAQKALGLSKVLMIPACVPPHKEQAERIAPPEQRMEMLRLSIAGRPGLEACDLELRRGGRSYTWQTVERLRELYPEAELVLCMGSDMLESFSSWREPEKILALASVAVLRRGGKDEQQRISRTAEDLEAGGARIYRVDNPVTEISSTNLRRLVAFGCAAPFLEEKTAEYIRQQGLYDSNAQWKNLPMDQLEQVVIRLLNPNRVRHVLGCRDTAAELARLWDTDVTDAARAGLLHDVTKALDGPLQLTLCSQYGIMLDEFSAKNPKTLHALTGSLVAERIFGENRAVVDAICSHTTGKAGMNTLEKIIYVADYMEPNRDFPGVEELRELARSNIDKALKLGLQMTLAVLVSRGSDISPESSEAIRYLEETGV